MKTRVTKYDGPWKNMPGKWYVGARSAEGCYGYIQSDGNWHTSAMPDGWFQTREAARKAARLARAKA